MMLKVEHEQDHVSIDATYLSLNGLNICLAMVLMSNLSGSFNIWSTYEFKHTTYLVVHKISAV